MDVMIDIETLGKKPGCVILSIGAIAFDPLSNKLPNPDDTGLVFYHNLTIFGQLMAGLEIDNETIGWWKKQTVPAKIALCRDELALPIVLNRLVTWLGNMPKGFNKIWARSPDFDCAIIEHAAKLTDINLPWDFRAKQDCRTIENVFNMTGKVLPATPPPVRTGEHHNALDDCYSQAMLVQYWMAAIQNG